MSGKVNRITTFGKFGGAGGSQETFAEEAQLKENTLNEKKNNKRTPALPDGEFVHPYRIFQGAHCICRAKEIQNVSKNIESPKIYPPKTK